MCKINKLVTPPTQCTRDNNGSKRTPRIRNIRLDKFTADKALKHISMYNAANRYNPDDHNVFTFMNIANTNATWSKMKHTC